jgi:hypothetical protein
MRRSSSTTVHSYIIACQSDQAVASRLVTSVAVQLPDLAPCDLFLFPKLKHSLKEAQFQSIEDIQRKTTDLLSVHTNDFQKCFHAWKERMQHCIEAQGNYFEGDNLQHT